MDKLKIGGRQAAFVVVMLLAMVVSGFFSDTLWNMATLRPVQDKIISAEMRDFCRAADFMGNPCQFSLIEGHDSEYKNVDFGGTSGVMSWALRTLKSDSDSVHKEAKKLTGENVDFWAYDARISMFDRYPNLTGMPEIAEVGSSSFQAAFWTVTGIKIAVALTLIGLTLMFAAWAGVSKLFAVSFLGISVLSFTLVHITWSSVVLFGPILPAIVAIAYYVRKGVKAARSGGEATS